MSKLILSIFAISFLFSCASRNHNYTNTNSFGGSWSALKNTAQKGDSVTNTVDLPLNKLDTLIVHKALDKNNTFSYVNSPIIDKPIRSVLKSIKPILNTNSAVNKKKKGDLLEDPKSGLEFLGASIILAIMALVGLVIGWSEGVLILLLLLAAGCYTASLVLAILRIIGLIINPEEYRKDIKYSIITLAIHAIAALAIALSYR